MAHRFHAGSRGRGTISVAAALLFALVSAAAAQDAANVFLPAPRTLRQHLTRAERALEEQRYGDAVLELGALLTDSRLEAVELEGEEPQDFFVGTLNAQRAEASLKSEAQRLLAAMPPQARELYELQFGGDARALLDAAVHDADIEKLYEVVRKYFHTEAGYEAMVLLGRLHLDHGRPLAAALSFQRVIEAPAAARKYDPELSVLLAACWLHARRPDKAQATMKELRARFPRARLNIGDVQADELPAEAGAVAWLERYFGPGPGTDDAEPAEWFLYRGNVSRTARHAGGQPLSTFRWQAPTATDPADAKLIQQIRSGFLNQGMPIVPGLQPLAVDDVILMRTPENLLAIDFESGKRIWEYPWWDSSYATAGTISNRAGPRNAEIEQRKEQLMQRLWYDAPYGQISSDGDAVYLLDDLRYAQFGHSESPWIPRPGRGRQPNPNWPQSYNELVALDLGREGSLRWRVGKDSGLDEPKLAGAFFLGPPLPLMEQLFVLAELNGEIRLIALDDQTGRQKWSQQLAHVDAYTILRNRTRRLAGATPSFGDGVLVCPTSAGAVVAVDLSTRALLWGFQYEPLPAPTRFGIPHPYQQRAANVGDRWLDATVTVASGAVLLTPVESNRLYCLDLLTGDEKWPPLERRGHLSEMLFLGGIYGQNAILVGKHSLAAIRLADGQPAWQVPVELDRERGEMPSGRGFLSGHHYYLPTSDAQLVKIDLERGEIVAREKTEQVLGNLVCYKDEVISQSADNLATYYQVEPLRRRVEQRLADAPDDAWSLARRGELLIHDGQPRQALVDLRRAFQLSPDDEAVRALLVKTYLTALRDDFAGHRAMAPELEQLIDRPPQRIEYLRLMAAGLHAEGVWAEAAEAYLELAQLISGESQRYDVAQPRMVAIDEDHSARLDRWLRGRMGELFAAAGDGVRQRMTSVIGDRLDAARGGSLDELESFLGYYGFHPLADQAQAALAEGYAEKERFLEAGLAFSALQGRADPAVVAPVAARMAGRLAEARQFAQAARYYARLNQDWPDTLCLDGQTGAQLYQAALEQPALAGLLSSSEPWPWGRAAAARSTGASDRSFRRVIPIPITAAAGALARDLNVSYDSGGASVIIVRDARGEGKLHLPLMDGRAYYQLNQGMRYAHLLGDLLLVVMGDHVLALDLTRGNGGEEEAVLWREPFAQTVPEIAIQSNRMGNWNLNHPFDLAQRDDYFVQDSTGKPVGRLGAATTSGVCYLKSRTLVCVEPATGQVLWQRGNIERGSTIFGDEQHIYVAARTSREALVFSAIDGQQVGRRSIPDWDHRWTTHGRYVLGWEQIESGHRLFLYDAWNERDIWSEAWAAGSRGSVIAASQVAMLEPGGRFVIRSLVDEHKIVDTQLQAEPNLREIHVLPTRQQYLLVTHNAQDADPSSDVSYKPVSGGPPAPLIHGRIYAFDPQTGRQQWQTPAVIEDFGLPLDQPHELPTLWFLRQVSSKRTQRAPAPSERTSVLCLDRRDGRLLFADDEIPTKTNSYHIVPDQAERSVELILPGHRVAVQFTAEPTPPAPPAQVGEAPRAPPSDQSALIELGGAIVNTILGRGDEQRGADREAPQEANP